MYRTLRRQRAKNLVNRKFSVRAIYPPLPLRPLRLERFKIKIIPLVKAIGIIDMLGVEFVCVGQRYFSRCGQKGS